MALKPSHPWAADLCHTPPNLCDAKGRLLSLSLRDKGLRCPSFPSQLGQLTSLERLDLRWAPGRAGVGLWPALRPRLGQASARACGGRWAAESAAVGRRGNSGKNIGKAPTGVGTSQARCPAALDPVQHPSCRTRCGRHGPFGGGMLARTHRARPPTHPRAVPPHAHAPASGNEFSANVKDTARVGPPERVHLGALGPAARRGCFDAQGDISRLHQAAGPLAHATAVPYSEPPQVLAPVALRELYLSNARLGGQLDCALVQPKRKASRAGAARWQASCANVAPTHTQALSQHTPCQNPTTARVALTLTLSSLSQKVLDLSSNFVRGSVPECMLSAPVEELYIGRHAGQRVHQRGRRAQRFCLPCS